MFKSAVSMLQFELRSRWDEPEFVSGLLAQNLTGLSPAVLSLPDDPGGLDHSQALILSLHRLPFSFFIPFPAPALSPFLSLNLILQLLLTLPSARRYSRD